VTVVGAQARYTCLGADHGEGKAQEGQVGRVSANRARAAQIDFLADEGPEDEQKAFDRSILGNGRRACRFPRLDGGSATGRRNVKRASRRRRVVGAAGTEQTPGGQNPRSATCLKMAGRRREEEAAERWRKPVSGTVVGGVGSAGAIPG
jgi:hypothetical protein